MQTSGKCAMSILVDWFLNVLWIWRVSMEKEIEGKRKRWKTRRNLEKKKIEDKWGRKMWEDMDRKLIKRH